MTVINVEAIFHPASDVALEQPMMRGGSSLNDRSCHLNV